MVGIYHTFWCWTTQVSVGRRHDLRACHFSWVALQCDDGLLARSVVVNVFIPPPPTTTTSRPPALRRRQVSTIDWDCT